MGKQLHWCAIEALTDNYIWLLHEAQAPHGPPAQAVVVDPGDAQPVLRCLAQQGLMLQAIVVTHHHADHTAGIAALQAAHQARHGAPLPVYGPAAEAIAGVSRPVQDGDAIELLGLRWQVLAVPGHTAGHVAYFVPAVPLAEGRRPMLFCGDTLFSAGCGRLFEGTAAQMLQSLQRLAQLPADTLLCCGHEYTLANMAFAQAVEPDNAQLASALQQARALRAQGRPTLPAPLGQERQINPFLRSREPAVRQALRHFLQGQQPAAGPLPQDDAQWFALLRAWKNQF
ncbi:MAG: hydroxyacylglutathione hydrolase [Comamonadaceae bacterium]|nr:hydroxyacylglutathione hydrolase [Comamonadaceae bacterium]